METFKTIGHLFNFRRLWTIF